MNIAILVEDQYQVLEVWYPYFRLREEDINTSFVGTGKREYKSKEGYPVTADISCENVDVNDFDGVIIPGGYAPDILRRYKAVNDFVYQMNSQGKVVASICHGGWVLASAKVLDKRTVTSFFAIKDDLVNAGAKFIDKEVVVDNNLITSRKPEDLGVFCKEIIKFCKNKKSKT